MRFGLMQQLGVVNGITDGSPNRLVYNSFGMPVTTNGASYFQNYAAPSGIVSLFGVFPSAPTRVTFESTINVEVDATILYSSTSQVNLVVPVIPPGPTSTMRLYNGTTLIGHGAPLAPRLDPGIFTANSAGSGLAAGELLRVNKITFQQTIEQISPTGNVLNPTTEDAYLILYATAIRNRTSLTSVSAKINNVTVPVAYAGAQGSYLGLDQINLGSLPSSLKGIGLKNITITVEGLPANIAQVNLL